VRALTNPTRGRITLWALLTVLWALVLPQDLAMDPGHEQFSVVGAAFWTAVLLWLLACVVATWRRFRCGRRTTLD
jgi:hypothetical protein